MTAEKLPYDVGELIADRYVVFSVLDRTPHSGTFQARDMETRNWAVIKVLFPRVNASEVAAFKRDMKRLVGLRDPHIVPALDAGATLVHGHRFVVYAQMDGDSLASALSNGGLPADIALETMIQVARGLYAAHSADVVHGGLTPRNVILVREGVGRRARISEFGLAGHVSAGGQLEPGPGDSIAGSFRHRAPEAQRGRAQSPSADIYAWALVFLEVLTGRPAVTGSSYKDVQRNQTALDPVEIAPELADRPEAAVLRKALEPNPSRRYTSFEDVLRDLGVNPNAEDPSSSLPQRVRFDRRPTRPKSITNVGKAPLPPKAPPPPPVNLEKQLAGSEALTFDVEDSSLIDPDPELVTFDGLEDAPLLDAEIELAEHEPRSGDNPLASLELVPDASALLSADLIESTILNRKRKPAAPKPTADADETDEADEEPLTWNLSDDSEVVAESPQPEPLKKGAEVGLETLRRMSLLDPEPETRTTPLRSSIIPKTIGIVVLTAMLTGMIAAIGILAWRKTASAPAEEIPTAEGAGATHGDSTDGDNTDRDSTDRDNTVGDNTDGDNTDGDNTDGDDTDGDDTDGDDTDGGDDSMDFDFSDGDVGDDGNTDALDTTPVAAGDCSTSAPTSCIQTGRALTRGPVMDRDETTASVLFQTACTAGPEYCVELAWLTLDGRGGLPPDPARAYQMAEEACAAGERNGCVMQGELLLEGRGTRRSYDKAAPLLEEACEDGKQRACTRLGDLIDRGKGGFERDLVRAAEMYAKACTSGHGRACGLLAEKHRKGRGVEKDQATRLELMQRGCQSGGGEVCYELGDIYRSGKGVDKDPATAVRWYQAGCNAGFSKSCDNACYIIQSGEWDQGTTEAAIPWCAAGCELGYAKACYRGGKFATAQAGEGSPGAVKLYTQGCALGDKKSCRNL